MRNPFQATLETYSPEGFVAKLNPAGSALVYSTYLGRREPTHGIAIDPSGNAYVTLEYGGFVAKIAEGAPPDLSISKSHTGNFTFGVNGVYILRATNVGTWSDDRDNHGNRHSYQWPELRVRHWHRLDLLGFRPDGHLHQPWPYSGRSEQFHYADRGGGWRRCSKRR